MLVCLLEKLRYSYFPMKTFQDEVCGDLVASVISGYTSLNHSDVKAWIMKWGLMPVEFPQDLCLSLIEIDEDHETDGGLVINLGKIDGTRKWYANKPKDVIEKVRRDIADALRDLGAVTKESSRATD